MATEDVHRLAEYALANDAFRREASAKGQFRKTLQSSYPAYGNLDEAEIQFSEDWLSLARTQLSDDPAEFDAQLVERVKTDLAEGEATRSG